MAFRGLVSNEELAWNNYLPELQSNHYAVNSILSHVALFQGQIASFPCDWLVGGGKGEYLGEGVWGQQRTGPRAFLIDQMPSFHFYSFTGFPEFEVPEQLGDPLGENITPLSYHSATFIHSTLSGAHFVPGSKLGNST